MSRPAVGSLDTRASLLHWIGCQHSVGGDGRGCVPLHLARFAGPKGSISDGSLDIWDFAYQQPFRDRFLTSLPSNSGFLGRGIE
jgi:hypothetical protein